MSQDSDSELPEDDDVPSLTSRELAREAAADKEDAATKKKRWLARVALLKAAKTKTKTVEPGAPIEASEALGGPPLARLSTVADAFVKRREPAKQQVATPSKPPPPEPIEAAAVLAAARELESKPQLDDDETEKSPPEVEKPKEAAALDDDHEPPPTSEHAIPAPRVSERTEWKAEPPKTELRLRRLAPAPPDRSRIYAAGVIGVLVFAGIGLLLASPKKPVVIAPPPLALTSGDMADAGTAAVASVEKKEAPAEPAPVVHPPPAWRVSALKDDASVDYVEGSFGKKGLVATLTGAGLSRSEIKRLNKAFDDVKHIDRPATGDKFALAKDKKGNVVAFEYIASPFEVWQARVDPANLAEAAAKDAGAKAPPLDLDAKKLEFFIEHKHVATAVVVKEDLAKTIAANNMKPELVDEIDDALEGHVEDGIHTGARMRFVSTEDVVDGNLVRVHLDAVELMPRSGNSVRVYYYERGADVDGSAKRAPAAGFYDGKGRQPYHGQFRPPLQLARITSRFNPNRMHPVLHVIMPHNGVDFAGSTGTPIYAAAAGTVLTAGDSGPCGNMVSIDHGGGLTTSYCHMSRIAPGIHAGMHVDSRQNIGFVGATGRVTGPHLHFVAKRNGVFIDPMTLKMDGVRVLPPADRDAFAAKRKELDGAIDGISLPASTGTDAPADSDEEDKDLHE